MMPVARRASLVVVLLLASVGRASGDCTCLPLRIFTPIQRADFEMRYGLNWWQAIGLIPGPSTPDDWVQRPSGDSLITVYSPQQFWDSRGCGTASKVSLGPN